METGQHPDPGDISIFSEQMIRKLLDSFFLPDFERLAHCSDDPTGFPGQKSDPRCE